MLHGDGAVEIARVEYDSRMIGPDSLFFAVRGYRRDGHDFLKQAYDNGAVAAMGERDNGDPIPTYVHVPDIRKAMADVSARFYGSPGQKLKAYAVTGTNGKTTTCMMLREILALSNGCTGLVTSQVYDTGKEKFTAERTTPESLDLQRLLYLMKKNQCVNVVIEASSHALVMHRLDNVNFRVAVYTNLTRDHLDFHKTMEEYLKAKASLLDKLDGRLGHAVINLDVPEFKPLFGRAVASFLSYSLDNRQADVRCGEHAFRADGTIFDLVTPMGNRTVRIKLPGRFNLMNALAAAAGGLASGADLDSVVAGLERTMPVPGRLNSIDVGQPFAVYVDYAHTPDAIERLCEAVRELSRGRLLLLFGCGGDRDRGKRPMMGRAAARCADYIVVTSDNPRGEDARAIIGDIKPGLKGAEYEIHVDRREGIAAIVRKAGPGDAVVLAGKGAETYQEIKGARHPFDEVAEVKAAVASLTLDEKTTDEGK